MVRVGIGLFAMFGAIGFSASDTALGDEYSDLFQAIRAPTLYHVEMALDFTGWMLMSAAIVLIARILYDHAPIRTILIATYGVGALTGMLGGVVRLFGITDLATRYALRGSQRRPATGDLAVHAHLA